MDINGGDHNRVFLHDLIKITEGTVLEGTIFMHIVKVEKKVSEIKLPLLLNIFTGSGFSSTNIRWIFR